MKTAMLLYVAIVLALLPFSEQSDKKSLNILGIFPYEGKSHFFVFEPYLQELARRGHNVTVISCFPRETPMKNYNDISLAGKSRIYESVIEIEHSYATVFKIINFIIAAGVQNCKVMLEDENVRNLWEKKMKFDLVVTEQFSTDCGLGIAYKLGVPVVGLTSHSFLPWHYDRLGIPDNPAFVPSVFFGGATTPTFYQRVERTIFNTFLKIYYKYTSQRPNEKTLAKYIEGIPPLEELATNIKFQLLYTNFVLFRSSLYPSNVIQVNGYHVKKAKPLPEDLRKFIDESEHGIVLISFGSMLMPSSAPDYVVKAVLDVASKLPQRIIWKWEKDTIPNPPKNIYISNWLPQNDILAHPKVLAFFSHCGLLGTTEAVYHGVPIVGMPVFGDQPSNAAAIEESGFGVQLQLNDVTEKNLLEKLKIVLDPSFRKRVKELSRAWHDRPLSAMDTAIYWTEYAATHNVTVKAPATTVPLYQYYNLDILGTLLLLLLILAYIVIRIIVLVISSIFGAKPSTKSKKPKTN
ncbi:UDP-glycosyltransferase UGT5-like [Aricia agestis]|uniref:UDP-glycosyltransferase UGT5-like n=1 Tax=Aricia agestis TaxID=91739 RepID=UPI001C206D90|nr:UDP-glycosyltransferase UGT5-like [Aricia agestis]